MPSGRGVFIIASGAKIYYIDFGAFSSGSQDKVARLDVRAYKLAPMNALHPMEELVEEGQAGLQVEQVAAVSVQGTQTGT